MSITISRAAELGGACKNLPTPCKDTNNDGKIIGESEGYIKEADIDGNCENSLAEIKYYLLRLKGIDETIKVDYALTKEDKEALSDAFHKKIDSLKKEASTEKVDRLLEIGEAVSAAGLDPEGTVKAYKLAIDTVKETNQGTSSGCGNNPYDSYNNQANYNKSDFIKKILPKIETGKLPQKEAEDLFGKIQEMIDSLHNQNTVKILAYADLIVSMKNCNLKDKAIRAVIKTAMDALEKIPIAFRYVLDQTNFYLKIAEAYQKMSDPEKVLELFSLAIETADESSMQQITPALIKLKLKEESNGRIIDKIVSSINSWDKPLNQTVAIDAVLSILPSARLENGKAIKILNRIMDSFIPMIASANKIEPFRHAMEETRSGRKTVLQAIITTLEFTFNAAFQLDEKEAISLLQKAIETKIFDEIIKAITALNKESQRESALEVLLFSLENIFSGSFGFFTGEEVGTLCKQVQADFLFFEGETSSALNKLINETPYNELISRIEGKIKQGEVQISAEDQEFMTKTASKCMATHKATNAEKGRLFSILYPNSPEGFYTSSLSPISDTNLALKIFQGLLTIIAKIPDPEKKAEALIGNFPSIIRNNTNPSNQTTLTKQTKTLINNIVDAWARAHACLNLAISMKLANWEGKEISWLITKAEKAIGTLKFPGSTPAESQYNFIQHYTDAMLAAGLKEEALHLSRKFKN